MPEPVVYRALSLEHRGCFSILTARVGGGASDSLEVWDIVLPPMDDGVITTGYLAVCGTRDHRREFADRLRAFVSDDFVLEEVNALVNVESLVNFVDGTIIENRTRAPDTIARVLARLAAIWHPRPLIIRQAAGREHLLLAGARDQMAVVIRDLRSLGRLRIDGRLRRDDFEVRVTSWGNRLRTSLDLVYALRFQRAVQRAIATPPGTTESRLYEFFLRRMLPRLSRIAITPDEALDDARLYAGVSHKVARHTWSDLREQLSRLAISTASLMADEQFTVPEETKVLAHPTP